MNGKVRTAVVGCGNATQVISDGQDVTVSCAEGDTGFVYEGLLDFEQQQVELAALPPAPVRIMMNVGNPDRAFAFAALPHQGVGLARLEFIINRMTKEEEPPPEIKGSKKKQTKKLKPAEA